MNNELCKIIFEDVNWIIEQIWRRGWDMPFYRAYYKIKHSFLWWSWITYHESVLFIDKSLDKVKREMAAWDNWPPKEFDNIV